MRIFVPNKEVKIMRKRIFIVCAIVILILVIPIPVGQSKDGGTRRYAALTYKIVDWHHLYGDNQIYDEVNVYFFPDNFLPLDDLIAKELSQ